ncbi:succinylglutamate desuccinylase/aspartoacylase family protein [Aurantibacillus circumpalustris]|uniref:succinylglutamate desuccinylase/aspartoacylase family protein n=1 Tax=Aurantibacillus circumpalustris TaxID=3036359 RepID=UPI00295AC2B4|nr:succinylglutamate desuccinylase/aspartoacylase family protein [Aurantibacillus circumpalustris]
MQETITINGQTIEPGQTKTVILNSYELHTKTKLEIPVIVIRSKKKGPTLLLSAGMHGEETNGIEIIRKVITRKDVRNLQCGTLIAIPVINVISFLFGSRDLPDGRDLNRCFPGNKKGSFGSRIAYDLMKHILPVIDFGIDFHTGGAKINNFPQIRCVFSFPENIALAEKFSAPLIIDSTYREGTFRKEAAKKGKPILVYEGGESMRFDYRAINEGVTGCMRLMKAYKMISTEAPGENPSVKIKKDTWVRANSSGLFHMSVNNGARVAEGDLLGIIFNPFGEIEKKILSPVTGYIVGINNQPVVNQGDALIHIGMEEA